MKKKVLAAIIVAMGILTACGGEEEQSNSPIVTVEAEPIASVTPESTSTEKSEEATETNEAKHP